VIIAGELDELIEEFSDGRIQFGFVKVKDPNTTLAKYVLIGWVREPEAFLLDEIVLVLIFFQCGEGVPERTKGYFTSHLAAASKVLRVCLVPRLENLEAYSSFRDITFKSLLDLIET
jgi:hypothetical protein